MVVATGRAHGADVPWRRLHFPDAIMSHNRILVTGGAGFVGSSLAISFKRERPTTEIIALDNLHRRGSELSLPRLEAAGIQFVKGDVRTPEIFEKVGAVDLLIECSAEPSVHAGYNGGSRYLVETNLMGAVNCLEHLREHGGDLVFLSSSRVYPIDALRALPLEPSENRLRLAPEAAGEGWSAQGISEDFSLSGSRTLYGSTKLSAELLIAEYQAMYGIRTIVNRCGVLAGPWQMGKVDQGFVTLWAARHLLGGKLDYMGYDGLQVRDILHVDDLFDLLCSQLAAPERHAGRVYNVGGGAANAVSLKELTEKCAALSRGQLEIGNDDNIREADIPWYVSENTRVHEATGWSPSRGVDETLDDIARWISDHRERLIPVFEDAA